MATALLGSSSTRLPNELAIIVLDQLADDKPSLCALAATCRGLQHLAEELIYQTIDLHSVTDLHAIIQAFSARHDRVRAVQTLKILYRYDPEDLDTHGESRTSFNDCIKDMVNLRLWHIESPYDNYHWDGSGGHEWVEGDMERFRSALEAACMEGRREADHIVAERALGREVDRTVGLALLQSLTIHSHGAHEDFWPLGNFDCLFSHPGLRHLHVSCVLLPNQEIESLRECRQKTPLTTLIFDECVLHPKSLGSILSTPAKLKHLTLGENVFNTRRTRGVNPVLSKNPFATLDALAPLAHSLESLIHLDPSWRTDTSPDIQRTIHSKGNGLRDFHSLRYMECETSSFLHEATIMNANLAPPNLETLRLRRHYEVGVSFWEQPPAPAVYWTLPSLSSLELVQASRFWSEGAITDFICQAERIRARHAYAYQLFKANINLKMFIELHGQWIPPYLHGELKPKPGCLYDASLVGFRRRLNYNPEMASEFTNCLKCERPMKAVKLCRTLPDDEVEAFMPSEMLNPTDHLICKPCKELQKNGGFDAPMASQNSLESTSKDQAAPETDQLDDQDIGLISAQVRRTVQRLRHRFTRTEYDLFGSDASDSDAVDFFDNDDDFDEEFSDEFDEEMDDFIDDEEDLELDLQALLDAQDGAGVQIWQHGGNLYIEMPVGEDNASEDEWEDAEEEHNLPEAAGGNGDAEGVADAAGSGASTAINDLD